MSRLTRALRTTACHARVRCVCGRRGAHRSPGLKLVVEPADLVSPVAGLPIVLALVIDFGLGRWPASGWCPRLAVWPPCTPADSLRIIALPALDTGPWVGTRAAWPASSGSGGTCDNSVIFLLSRQSGCMIRDPVGFGFVVQTLPAGRWIRRSEGYLGA